MKKRQLIGYVSLAFIAIAAVVWVMGGSHVFTMFTQLEDVWHYDAVFQADVVSYHWNNSFRLGLMPYDWNLLEPSALHVILIFGLGAIVSLRGNRRIRS